MNEAKSKSSAPLQVILMFVIIVATIALGFFMVPDSEEERQRLLGELGTTNHGTLLSPMVSIDELPLESEGAPWQWQDHNPKWRMLILGDSRCLDDCGQMLYISRQMHIRLGKYSHRFERLYVNTDGALSDQLAKDLAANHPYIKVVNAGRKSLEQWLSNNRSQHNDGVAEAILVDPAGRAMMVYDARQTGNDMLEDINHLLKYSHE